MIWVLLIVVTPLLFGITVEKARRIRTQGLILFLHIRNRVFSSTGTVPSDLLSDGVDEGQVFCCM